MNNFKCTYDYDCDCIDICKSIDGVYNLCKKDATLGANRCTPGEKNMLVLLNKISNQLDELLKK